MKTLVIIAYGKGRFGFAKTSNNLSHKNKRALLSTKYFSFNIYTDNLKQL